MMEGTTSGYRSQCGDGFWSDVTLAWNIVTVNWSGLGLAPVNPLPALRGKLSEGRIPGLSVMASVFGVRCLTFLRGSSRLVDCFAAKRAICVYLS